MFKNKNVQSFFILVIVSALLFYIERSLFPPVLDSFLNLHNIQLLYNGYTPYAQINIITTPLYHFLGVLFLKIFGYAYYTYNIYGTLVHAFIIGAYYILIKKLEIKEEEKKIIIIISILAMFVSYVNTYSWLSHLIVLTIIIIHGTDFVKNKWIKMFATGLLIGCAFLTKQNIGIYCIIAYIIIELLKEKKININLIKHYFISACGFIIVLVPFIIYIIKKDCFYDFFDLCFGGIGEFYSHNVLRYYDIVVASIWLIANDIKVAIKSIKNNNNFKLTYSIYSIALMLFIIPIFDSNHLYFCIFPSLFLLIESFSAYIKKTNNKNVNKLISRFVKGILIFLIIVDSAQFLFSLYNCRKTSYNDERAFYNGFLGIDDNKVELGENIWSFINQKKSEGYDVLYTTHWVILDLLPYEYYNTRYDIFLEGNYGAGGRQNVIDYMESLENPLVIYLYGDMWQESLTIKKYIEDNYEIIEAKEIQPYRAYIKKKS